MTIELITFIGAILFGVLLYWRESNGNGIYRFVNKLAYSKDLQMKPEDKKGFIYQQSLLLRIVYITALFLIGIVITRFLIPIDLATISLFASMIVGTLAGTYIAAFVFKSGEVIDEKSDSIEDVFHETIEKGKDFIEDLKEKSKDSAEAVEEKAEEIIEDVKEDAKSARDRLKDKGLL
jgi:Na+/H+ antiporter NhaC